MTDSTDPQGQPDGDLDRASELGIDQDIEAMNRRLSDWAARSAAGSDALIERFERMGYEVRGKSEGEIADALRRPPTRPPA